MGESHLEECMSVTACSDTDPQEMGHDVRISTGDGRSLENCNSLMRSVVLLIFISLVVILILNKDNI